MFSFLRLLLSSIVQPRKTGNCRFKTMRSIGKGSLPLAPALRAWDQDTLTRFDSPCFFNCFHFQGSSSSRSKKEERRLAVFFYPRLLQQLLHTGNMGCPWIVVSIEIIIEIISKRS